MKQLAIFPIPPSANSMWKHSRTGVFRSREYKSWTELASLQAKQQLDAFPGQVEIVIIVRSGPGWRWNRDVDNIIKPTIDMLVRSGRIVGDTCQTVRRVTTEFIRHANQSEPAVLFTRITEYVEPDTEFIAGFAETILQLRGVSPLRPTRDSGAVPTATKKRKPTKSDK